MRIKERGVRGYGSLVGGLRYVEREEDFGVMEQSGLKRVLNM